MPLRGLSESKQGRLAIIFVVAGTLMIAVALGNMAMTDAADATADDVRRHLRRELAAVSDEALAAYPASADAIEAMAVEAVADEPARVLGSVRRDDEVVVAVQAGWGWQIRCIEAELRGGTVVLTYAAPRPC